MTYREFYAQNSSKCFPPDRVHMLTCPDSIEYIKKADPNCKCPYRDMPGEKYCCKDCWDREMPEGCISEPASTPEKPVNGEATARVLAEAVDDVIHMSADGDVHDLILCALGAVHIAAKEIYDSAKDKLAAEKIIHEMQNALSPTGEIWGFDDE